MIDEQQMISLTLLVSHVFHFFIYLSETKDVLI